MTGRTVAVIAAGLLSGAAAAPSERVVTGESVIAGTVAGVPGRFLLDPGAPSMPLLTTDYAARAGLKGGMFGMRYAVGPVIVAGATAETPIGFGAVEGKRRVGWTARAYHAGYDGSVGPGGLPEDVVRFVLRPSLPGERTVTAADCSAVPQGFSAGSRWTVGRCAFASTCATRAASRPRASQSRWRASSAARLATMPARWRLRSVSSGRCAP